jgi:hypothetical protein
MEFIGSVLQKFQRVLRGLLATQQCTDHRRLYYLGWERHLGRVYSSSQFCKLNHHVFEGACWETAAR